MSYLCHKCKKNWGPPSSFQNMWKTILILINWRPHGPQWFIVKNIEGESTEANDLSLIL